MGYLAAVVIRIYGATEIQGKQYLFFFVDASEVLRQCLIFRSFIEQPIVMQSPNENTLIVTWSEAYLHLIKCVDYFYVQYALAEGEDENG